MFCTNCGKKIEDTSKFCPYCGAVVAPDVQAPAYSPSPAPAGGPAPVKRNHTAAILTAIAAVVVVAFVVGLLAISGVFGGAKGKVEKAFGNTLEAYQDAKDAAGLPDLSDLLADQKYSQSAEWKLAELNGSYLGDDELSALAGISIRYTADVDLKGRQMGVSVTPSYGAADLLTVQLAIDDANVYLGSPELTGDAFYGVNTETLGTDLEALGADLDELSGLSFNIFDLVEKLQDVKPDKDSKEALEDAAKDLVKAISVEKAGTETIGVNGYDIKCTAYHVVIPQSAMEDYLTKLEDVMENQDYSQILEDLAASFGLPDDVVDEMLYGIEEVSYQDVFDALEDVLEMLEDVELQVYLKGSYVMAVTYENEIDGTELELGLYLGGGKNYADDLRLEISIDDGDAEIVLTSSGDHTAKDGALTDSTVLKIKENGETVAKVTSKLRYAAKEKEDNFSWSIDAEDFSIDLEGLLRSEKNELTLQLDEITLEAYGEELLTLRLDYSIGAYEKHVAVTGPVMLADLTEDDLMEIAEEIEDNAYNWIMGLMDQIPDLAYLL